jgi:hypothetical protein
VLDFTELSKDGQDLELLIREILFRKGFSVYWSGKGADGGRDLVCIERRNSFFVPDEKRWLIQCKHNAIAGKSVGISDLDNIVDSCEQHQCRGYLLVSSTQPSSTVVQRLEAITANTRNFIEAIYWDAVKIEQILSTPKNWSLAQRFFPISANAENWQVYATENPNHWVVNYKGYYFHLHNRIRNYKEYHLESIKNRITEIESISLPEEHFLRIRAIYYDDKNGNYTWYLDYMYPIDKTPSFCETDIAELLGDGYIFEDGQTYMFDVIHRSYFKHDDHYDPDHYDYYQSDTRFFSYGFERPHNYNGYKETREFQTMMDKEKDRGYQELISKLSSLPFFTIRRSCNATIESLDRFHLKRNWAETINELELESDRFFSAWFLIDTDNELEFHRLITFIPQSIEKHFRLAKSFVYIPSDDFKRSVRDDTVDEYLYELTLSIHPSCITNKITGRALLNDYFYSVSKSIDTYLGATHETEYKTR